MKVHFKIHISILDIDKQFYFLTPRSTGPKDNGYAWDGKSRTFESGQDVIFVLTENTISKIVGLSFI